MLDACPAVPEGVSARSSKYPAGPEAGEKVGKLCLKYLKTK